MAKSKIEKSTSESLGSLSWEKKTLPVVEIAERTEQSTDAVPDTVTPSVRQSVKNSSPNLDALLSDDVRRVTRRYPFDFYVDQLEKLDWLDEQSRAKRKRAFNKSEYVRKALDRQLEEDGLS